MTDETGTTPAATGVEDEMETLAAHVEDSDAEQDVHEALAAVKAKVDELALGAETDARTIEQHVAAIAERDAKAVKADAGIVAADLHKDLVAVKADAFQAVRSDRTHALMLKLEALIKKVEAAL